MNFAALLICLIASIFNASAVKVVTSERIYNGHRAGIANTKHQVSIRVSAWDTFFFGLGHICGGSLISPTVVLTAAHCMRTSENVPRDKNSLVVVMGTLTRNVRDNNTLVYDIVRYVVHPNYDRSKIANDIAYIILAGEVPSVHPTVQPIALATSKVASGTMCQVSGWGITEKGIPSDDLLTVDVPIIDMDVCNAGYEGRIYKVGQICAGYMEGGKDSCEGDSGGPLVCNGNLTGIVSFGDGCAKKNTPGVYTDVLYFENWLRNSGASRKPLVIMILLVWTFVLMF